MTPEPTAGFTVEFTSVAGQRRRVRFEPLSDGKFERVTERYTGCKWIPEGREPVQDVTVDGGEVHLP